VEGEPTRSEPSSQSEPTQSDFEALCRRLTAKLEVVNAENAAVREENNKLRNRIAALREEMNAHYAVRHENTALKEEVKSLRGNNAKLQLDYQRLEFLVNEKSRDEGRLS
jgi:predicted nuclease with TOPRIM domain